MCYGSYKTAIRHIVFRKPLRKVTRENNGYQKYIGLVGSITGADLFLKNNSFAKFDEVSFMYYEETDLLLQMTKCGKKLYLIDGPAIVHLEGGSAKKIEYEVIDQTSFSNLCFLLSQIIFYKKNKLATKQELFKMKLLTLIFWLNPLIYKKTFEYRKKLCREWSTTF